MKKQLYKLLILFVLIGCASPKNLIKHGKYDKAISVLVKKLTANPDKEKHIQSLRHAYSVANSINLDKIKQLRATGQPDVWYDIYLNYRDLQQREDLVKRVPDQVKKAIDFVYNDFSESLNNAKSKAAAYFYAHAKKLLENGEKEDARRAYTELKKITVMYPDYKETDALIRKALVLGTDYILYEVNNRTTTIVPQSLIVTLQNINLLELDEQFLSFDTYPVEGRIYDFRVVLTLTQIQSTPEKIRESHYTESREIVERYVTKKDEDGKVVKDENGDPVKIPVYQKISCEITEVEKSKSVRINGFVDFVNNASGRVVNSTPVTAESVFNNITAYLKGDKRACSERTLELAKQPKLPFPPTPDMIMDAAEKLKEVVKEVIWHGEGYIQN
ncbi:MAG: hypothetical protein K9G67_11445 [Bacteroidales bacterium]|nr:hypothetical protein [Bacteroidales bacterium]MCF8343979.1 hypothetical protein [Bacteroidales bacterium]MCF8351110.1 hypothetical protein [Bacteroidales bacterium]MCF8376961.1 hypothetical protein [Bacteroidales bacterium]MCF8401303.1 hypothetical protein [Bacteroidales bacterium]